MKYFLACFLTLITLKDASAKKSISIFKAYPFLVYFDIVLWPLIVILTVALLILTALHFHRTKPCTLKLTRPSSFEYFVLKGEQSCTSQASSQTYGKETGQTASESRQRSHRKRQESRRRGQEARPTTQESRVSYTDTGTCAGTGAGTCNGTASVGTGSVSIGTATFADGSGITNRAYTFT